MLCDRVRTRTMPSPAGGTRRTNRRDAPREPKAVAGRETSARAPKNVAPRCGGHRRGRRAAARRNYWFGAVRYTMLMLRSDGDSAGETMTLLVITVRRFR